MTIISLFGLFVETKKTDAYERQSFLVSAIL